MVYCSTAFSHKRVFGWAFGGSDLILNSNSSVQVSCSVLSDSLRPHGLQHTRLPCPSPNPGVCSNLCPYWWTIMPSNHLILCRPLLLLPSIFPSIRVFSNESVLHIRWPKYWSFSFSIHPFNEYSGLIWITMDWLDLLTHAYWGNRVLGELANILVLFIYLK